MRKNIFKDKKFGLIIKIAVSSLLVLAIVLGLGLIWRNDVKLAKENDESKEDYYMELPTVDYGEEGFKVVTENEKLALLANIPTGEVALQDKATGKIWYSNPQDREQDTTAVIKTRSHSQVVLKFIEMESGNDLTIDSRLGCVLRRGLDYELTKNGIKFIYRFPIHGVVVPLEYTLKDDCFEAKIITDEIEEYNTEAFMLMDIGVLPFFGAGSVADNGYMFVPDGSGALINYNNGKTNSAEYSAMVYGSDTLVAKNESSSKASIRMPVFGNKTNDQGFLGIITSGEAEGTIKATVSGIASNYNQVYTSMNYREVFITEMTSNGKLRTLKQYSDCNLDGSDFTVRYYPLTGNDANYSAMANLYRKYLKETGVLSDKTESKSSLAVELYGAIRVKENVLGVQKDVVTPLTNYEQAKGLIEDLYADGVNNFDMLYLGWNSGGMRAAINDSVSPEKVLGGKKTLQELLNTANEKQVNLYLGNDFTNLYRNGNGYSLVADASKLMTQNPAKLFEFRYASQEENTDAYRSLLSPSLISKTVSNYVKSALKYNAVSVAETTFASQLYSDYGKKTYSLRYQSQKTVVDSLKQMSEKIDNVAVTDGNLYAIPYVDTVFDVPVNSSGYDMVDESVPFYTMVLHGYVQMTTDSINLSETPKKSMLKAIETGCIPKYTFIFGDPSVLIGTEYSDLFNISVDDWYEKIVDEYKQNADVFSKIGSLEVVSHTMLEKNVYLTEYEDGTKIIVNYNDVAKTVNGVEIEAMGYKISE